jgi:rRNA maturation protein Nop10
MNIQKTQQGFGLVKVLVSIPLLLIGLVILAFSYTELNKAYWDYRVKELCEKDGGVTVFEKVKLSKEEYELNEGRNGAINVMSEDTSKTAHQYAWKSITKVINSNQPHVWRTEYVTYRKSDNKELGTWVIYSRRGGDFPTGVSHPSKFSCRDIEGFETDVIKVIFLIEGE